MEEMWVARDENGKIYLYRKRPNKDHAQWYSNDLPRISFLRLADECFPEVKWSDDEPTKVKLLIDIAV